MSSPRFKVREALLSGLGRFVIARPRLVLVLGALLALGAGALALRIRISASRHDMARADDPEQRKYLDFLQAFGTQNQLIALIDGGDPARRRLAADRFAEAIQRDRKRVRGVFYKLDLEVMTDHALEYLDARTLDDLGKALGAGDAEARVELAEVAERMRKIDGLKPLGEALADAAEALPRLAGPEARKPPRPGEAHDDRPFRVAGALADELKAALGDARDGRFDPSRLRQQVSDILESEPGGPGGGKRAPPPAWLRPITERLKKMRSSLDEKGYVAAQNAGFHLVFVIPTSESDDTDFILPFVKKAREAAREVSRDPALSGVTIRIGGLPALYADENNAISTDMTLTGIVSFLGVAFLYLVIFRLGRQAGILILALGVGMLWTFGFIAIYPGRLTLVSSVFVPIVLGLGDDFGVHFLARINEERAGGKDMRAALEAAYLHAGPSVLTGALTMTFAFFAMSLSKFGAFSELGRIAAAGLLLELLSAFTLMPAMLLLFGGTRVPPTAAAHEVQEPLSGVYLRRARRLALGVVATGLVLAGLAGWAATKLRYDYDLWRLLPKKTDSGEVARRLSGSSDVSVEFGAMVVPTLEEVRRITRALKVEEVSRVDSIIDFLPDPDPGREAALRRVGEKLASIRWKPEQGQGADAPAPAEVAKSFRRFGDALDELSFTARKNGREKDAADLAGLGKRVAELAAAIEKAPAARVRRVDDQVRDLVRRSLVRLEAIAQSAAKGPRLTAERLPPELRKRFVSPKGEYAIYINPKRGIAERPFTERFVARLKQAAGPSIIPTGFPVTYLKYSQQINEGFVQAAIYCAVVILITLLVDFRSPKYLLLCVLPLALGGLWMAGLMLLFGLEINIANVVAIPLVIGLGIDFGVHILHRYREEGAIDTIHVLRTTGRAVVLAAATTLLGFGSLGLATHRGVASFGYLLIFGIGGCLIAAIVILPAVLTLLSTRKR